MDKKEKNGLKKGLGLKTRRTVAYIVLLVILALRPNGLFAASAVRK